MASAFNPLIAPKQAQPSKFSSPPLCQRPPLRGPSWLWSMTSLRDLPDEVLVLILRGFTICELARLERTSQRLHNVIRGNLSRLWRDALFVQQDGNDANVSLTTAQMYERMQSLQKRFSSHRNAHHIGISISSDVEHECELMSRVIQAIPALHPRNVYVCFSGDTLVYPSIFRCLYDLLSDESASLRSLVVHYQSFPQVEIGAPFSTEKEYQPATQNLSSSPLERLALVNVNPTPLLQHLRLRDTQPKLTKLALQRVKYAEIFSSSTVHNFLRSLEDTLQDLSIGMECYTPQHTRHINSLPNRLSQPFAFSRLRRMSLQYFATQEELESIRPPRFVCPRLQHATLMCAHTLNYADLLQPSLETLHLAVDQWMKPLDDADLDWTSLLGRCVRLRAIFLEIMLAGAPTYRAVLDALCQTPVPIRQVYMRQVDAGLFRDVSTLVRSRLPVPEQPAKANLSTCPPIEDIFVANIVNWGDEDVEHELRRLEDYVKIHRELSDTIYPSSFSGYANTGFNEDCFTSGTYA